MDEKQALRNRIKELLLQLFKFEIPLEEMDEEMMLINGGFYLESAAAIEFILELEKEFGISFDNDDLNLLRNNSIHALAEYIHCKRNS